MQLRKLGLSWKIWMKSWCDVSLQCFCSSVSLCGMNFAQILPFFKYSWRTESSYWCLIHSPSFWEPIDGSCITISQTSAVMTAFREVEGLPLLWSYWRSSCPPLNRRNHSDTLLWLEVSSSQAVLIHCLMAQRVTAVKNTTNLLSCYRWTVSDWIFWPLPIVGKRYEGESVNRSQMKVKQL
jgi:hypothetical protein